MDDWKPSDPVYPPDEGSSSYVRNADAELAYSMQEKVRDCERIIEEQWKELRRLRAFLDGLRIKA